MSTTYTSVANSVALYLASIGALGLTAGSTIFSEMLPDEPDKCVAVFERPGAATLMTLTGGTQLPQSLLDRPMIQIRVRSAMDDFTYERVLILTGITL